MSSNKWQLVQMPADHISLPKVSSHFDTNWLKKWHEETKAKGEGVWKLRTVFTIVVWERRETWKNTKISQFLTTIFKWVFISFRDNMYVKFVVGLLKWIYIAQYSFVLLPTTFKKCSWRCLVQLYDDKRSALSLWQRVYKPMQLLWRSNLDIRTKR